eukprot:5012019-Prymnesium_polylepis.2
MARGSKSTFVELQVHHALVYAYNENSHAHGPYEFFRSKLGSSYGPELNTLLERTIVFMNEVFDTPVLLSMLTLCLAHHRDGSPLPTTLLELYSAAMSGAMLAAGHADGDRMSADAWTVIKRAATSNML